MASRRNRSSRRPNQREAETQRGERCWRGWKQNSCLKYVFPKCYPAGGEAAGHGPGYRTRSRRPGRPPQDGGPATTTYSDIYLRTGGDYNPETAPKFELRSGRVMRKCDCLRRNGLQDDCYRLLCGGRPECKIVPEPECEPSKGGRNVWQI